MAGNWRHRTPCAAATLSRSANIRSLSISTVSQPKPLRTPARLQPHPKHHLPGRHGTLRPLHRRHRRLRGQLNPLPHHSRMPGARRRFHLLRLPPPLRRGGMRHRRRQPPPRLQPGAVLPRPHRQRNRHGGRLLSPRRPLPHRHRVGGRRPHRHGMPHHRLHLRPLHRGRAQCPMPRLPRLPTTSGARWLTAMSSTGHAAVLANRRLCPILSVSIR